MIRILGYVAFFVVAYVGCLYLSFPWGAVKERALQAVTKSLRRPVTAQKLEPSWITGVHAEGVEIELDGVESPIVFKTLDARAHVLDFLTGGYGGNVSFPIAQGKVNAEASGSTEKVAIQARAESVELGLIPALKEATGLALSGTLDFDANLDLGLEDAKTSQGSIEIRGTGLETLKGSKAGNYPVPELLLGDLAWTIPVEDGKAIIRNQKLEGPNVMLNLDGEIVLNNIPNRSLVNLTMRFKPTPEFLRKEPLLASLLKNIDRYKSRDGFYNYQISGTLKRPRVTPKRG